MSAVYFAYFFFQDVKFPMTLDVFELCTPELQTKLQPSRDKFKEEDEKNVLKVNNI